MRFSSQHNPQVLKYAKKTTNLPATDEANKQVSTTSVGGHNYLERNSSNLLGDLNISE